MTRCNVGGQKAKSIPTKEDSATKLRIRRSDRDGGAPGTPSAPEIEEGCVLKLRSRKNKVIWWLNGTNVICFEMIWSWFDCFFMLQSCR